MRQPALEVGIAALWHPTRTDGRQAGTLRIMEGQRAAGSLPPVPFWVIETGSSPRLSSTGHSDRRSLRQRYRGRTYSSLPRRQVTVPLEGATLCHVLPACRIDPAPSSRSSISPFSSISPVAATAPTTCCSISAISMPWRSDRQISSACLANSIAALRTGSGRCKNSLARISAVCDSKDIGNAPLIDILLIRICHIL